MAKIHGKNGSIYWAAAAGPARTKLDFAQSWSLDATVDTVEVSAMGDDWKAYLQGFTDWTAQVECLLDTTGLDIPLDPVGTPVGLGHGTAVNLELYMVYDSTTPLYKMLWGAALCTGIDVRSSNDDVIRVAMSFEGSGALAYYADASLKVYS